MACSSCGKSVTNNTLRGAQIVNSAPAKVISMHPSPYVPKQASGSVGTVRVINSAKIVRRTI